MKKWIYCLILVAGGMIFAWNASAQSSIGISPLSFEVTANPGDVIENYLKVYNPSPESNVQIQMIVEDIAPSGEWGHVIVKPAETETYSLAGWIKTEPKEFNLAPKEEKFVKFTISVPKNAEPGGHYGTVIAAAKVVAGPGATGAAIAPRIGSLVLLTVPGAIKEKLSVKDFSVSRRYFSRGPIPFSIKLENEGTVHTKPVALVTITDWRGKKVGELQLPQRNVLPGAVRKFDTSWNRKWLFGGKYIATLSGSYGIESIPLKSSVITFWAFPWKVGVAILLVLLLLVLSRKRWLAAFHILIRGEKILEADKR